MATQFSENHHRMKPTQNEIAALNGIFNDEMKKRSESQYYKQGTHHRGHINQLQQISMNSSSVPANLKAYQIDSPQSAVAASNFNIKPNGIQASSLVQGRRRDSLNKSLNSPFGKTILDQYKNQALMSAMGGLGGPPSQA